MTDYDKGWISALIDGEGCLHWERDKRINRKYPIITIGNTNFVLLLRAQKLLGGKLYGLGAHASYHKVYWQLDIRFPSWKNWLHEIPLIQKEVLRQEFLLWSLKK